MFTLRATAVIFFISMFPFSIAAAAPIFKCTIGGTVTYQASPCPSGVPRRTPTVEQLNAERQQKLSQAAVAPGAQKARSVGEPTPALAATQTALPATARKCDGRKVCSQMTSCAEAKYFLANCPGTKMDGDRDGIPCEEQWCTN